MNTLRKIFEGSCVATLGALEKPDGTLTEPGQPTLDFLMQAHFPAGCEITETPYNHTKSITLQELQSMEIDWITPELIKTVFKLFKSKKSPGTDGIKPIAYKYLPTNIIQHLQLIYKAVIIPVSYTHLTLPTIYSV